MEEYKFLKAVGVTGVIAGPLNIFAALSKLSKDSEDSLYDFDGIYTLIAELGFFVFIAGIPCLILASRIKRRNAMEAEENED